MMVRAELRTATRARHDAVDALFSRLDFQRPGHYRAFLRAQAAAFLPIEQAIDLANGSGVLADWPTRRRAHLLINDLAEWDLTAEPVPAPLLASPPAVLGAIYVLEGSRLGARLLRKGLPSDWPARFMNAPSEPDSWRNLMVTLDNRLDDRAKLAAAIQSAIAVFGSFETAGQLLWERQELA